MKAIKYILAGILFGIVMTKSEAISWYRIQEMFRFQAFHMYGIIGTAVVIGAIAHMIIKKKSLKDMAGRPIVFKDKAKTWRRYIIGGTIFGMGWALTGACPGPMFVNFGFGYMVFIVVIAAAALGTYAYGALLKRLPH
ncbi:MAG TPA: DUF6691 family protein [Cryomorphaceae bacterium]|nr:DUF6691 family protein [Cryomorphaceae bacterium]HKL40184.1 DUF6691 family protein [Cryomorphaceae bacterium]